MAEEQNTQRQSLLSASMNVGTILGIYYVLKFVLFPFSISSGFAGLLFIGLTIYVPFLANKLTKRFRLVTMPEGRMTFAQSWSFVIGMFLFASLLVAVAHYIYFAFIDQGRVIAAFNDSLTQMAALSAEGIPGTDAGAMQTQLDMMRQTIDSLSALTPIQITMELFINNLFWGCLLGLPIAAINANKNGNVNGNGNINANGNENQS